MLPPAFATGVRLLIVAAIAIGATTGVFLLTKDRIAEQQQASERNRLGGLLPPEAYDNDPLHDTIVVRAPNELGLDQATIHRAFLDGKPAALVTPVVARDGYNGPIRLLVAMDADGSLLGVEVVEHRETPGLGDDITRTWWRDQFVGKSLANTEADSWAVKKNGGDFDQFTGATITPRAVVNAVHRALQYLTQNRQTLFAAP